jgi:alkylation response protein AidB-like acyl-CoA dehydrogenase
MIVGAHLPDGSHIYLYCPTDAPGHVRSSPPLALCAMDATETTEVTLTDLFVPRNHWLRNSSPAELARGDLHNAAMTTAPMLGVAQGSLKTLRAVAERRPLPALLRASEALAAELAACRSECLACIAGFEVSDAYKARAHAARAWAIELGVRAGHMAVAAASGPANNRTHPAQRRLREAMFYTVYQQTGDIAEAILDRLVRPEFLS